jgi:hypothetical protein
VGRNSTEILEVTPELPGCEAAYAVHFDDGTMTVVEFQFQTSASTSYARAVAGNVGDAPARMRVAADGTIEVIEA